MKARVRVCCLFERPSRDRFNLKEIEGAGASMEIMNPVVFPWPLSNVEWKHKSSSCSLCPSNVESFMCEALPKRVAEKIEPHSNIEGDTTNSYHSRRLARYTRTGNMFRRAQDK
jgi:hypothetical protein